MSTKNLWYGAKSCSFILVY